MIVEAQLRLCSRSCKQALAIAYSYKHAHNQVNELEITQKTVLTHSIKLTYLLTLTHMAEVEF